MIATPQVTPTLRLTGLRLAPKRFAVTRSKAHPKRTVGTAVRGHGPAPGAFRLVVAPSGRLRTSTATLPFTVVKG